MSYIYCSVHLHDKPISGSNVMQKYSYQFVFQNVGFAICSIEQLEERQN